jgi:nitrate reductase NapE component
MKYLSRVVLLMRKVKSNAKKESRERERETIDLDLGMFPVLSVSIVRTNS